MNLRLCAHLGKASSPSYIPSPIADISRTTLGPCCKRTRYPLLHTGWSGLIDGWMSAWCPTQRPNSSGSQEGAINNTVTAVMLGLGMPGPRLHSAL